jgi:hypothetical protein
MERSEETDPHEASLVDRSTKVFAGLEILRSGQRESLVLQKKKKIRT